MSKRIFLIIICLGFTLSFSQLVVGAQSTRFKNKVRKAERVDAYLEKVDKIPIYKERLHAGHTLLGVVRGFDALTRKKENIFRQMRLEADKMGATAIGELECKKLIRQALLQCQGMATRLKKGLPILDEPEDSVDESGDS